MNSKKLGKFILRAAVAAYALALSACGGSGEPKAGAPIASSPATVTAAAPTQSASSTAVSQPQTQSAPPVAASELEVASAPVSASTPAVPSVPAPAQVAHIDVYGDDSMMGLTAMNMIPTMAQTTEPQGSQTLLRAQFGDGITIANHATGGTSSSLQNEMLGMDGNGAPFADRIKASPAQIVIDNHAVHDELGGETVDDYRTWLAQWVVAVRAARKVPVLEEPNPVSDGEHPQLAAYVQAMDDAAALYNVPIIKQYAYVLSLPNWSAHLTNGFYPDDWLLDLKAQRQAAALAEIIKQLPN